MALESWHDVGYRAASWMPVVALFAVLAAVGLDAADVVITTQLGIGLVAVVIDAVILVRAFDRHM